jgi:hypothetical protein
VVQARRLPIAYLEDTGEHIAVLREGRFQPVDDGAYGRRAAQVAVNDQRQTLVPV